MELSWYRDPLVIQRWNDRSYGDQSEDEDSNSEDNIPDPDWIKIVPKGEPLAINDGLSNMDEDISEDYYSGSDKDDATLSAHKNTIQL